MKTLKKVLLAVLVVLVMLVMIIVLAAKMKDNNSNDVTNLSETTETSDMTDVTENTPNVDVNSIIDEDQAVAETTEYLTAEELEEFSKWASKADTYGFLLSTYSDVVDADLEQVFYAGAGIDSPMTDEDVEEYLAISEFGSIETDMTKIYAKDMDEFLQKKVGHSLEEMKKPGFEYSEKLDCYYHQHGDTNGVNFTCVEGEIQGDLLVLKFSAGADDSAIVAITTVENNGDDYRIISNEYFGN